MQIFSEHDSTFNGSIYLKTRGPRPGALSKLKTHRIVVTPAVRRQVLKHYFCYAFILYVYHDHIHIRHEIETHEFNE